MVITPEQQPFIQAIHSDWYGGKVAELAMLRLDVIHKDVSGNKWYKLKYNIEHCLRNDYQSILTFGGAYSNHLAATAAIARLAGIQSIGIVKGKYAETVLTPTLTFCLQQGMQLEFATNEEYALKYDGDWLQTFSARYPGTCIIPEGGANDCGVAGAAEIAELIPGDYTHVAVSVGTGSTLAGVAKAVSPGVQVIGFAPMKGGTYLQDNISKWVARSNFIVYDDWYFGGFGKHTPGLLHFMNDFYLQLNIPLDMVYTAKMMYGLREQILNGLYDKQAKILCLHTGGLQGNVSLKDKLVY